MEGTRYWLWSRRNLLGRLRGNHQSVSSNYHPSWEEKAFAEDSSGLLGGCIWPPRSYTCTFCRREFRSAQALGGHMNVHRRDRARLRQQSPILQMKESDQKTSQYGLVDQYQSREVLNPNPNPTLNPSPKVSVTSSTYSYLDNKCDESPLTLASNYQKLSFSPHEAKASNAFSTVHVLRNHNDDDHDDAKFKGQVNCVPELTLDGLKKTTVCGCRKFDLVGSDGYDDGATVYRKRAKACNGGTLPLLLRYPAQSDRNLDPGHRNLHSEYVRDQTQSVVEELDLELRLGQRHHSSSN